MKTKSLQRDRLGIEFGNPGLGMNRSTMMIMRIEESAIVLSLLKSDLRPMEDVLSEFDSKFESARYLSVCNSLSMMLQACFVPLLTLF